MSRESGEVPSTSIDTKVFADTIVQWTRLFKSGLIAIVRRARPPGTVTAASLCGRDSCLFQFIALARL